MNRQLIIEPEAEREMHEARLWYEKQRAGLGEEFIDEVDDVLRRIVEIPNVSVPMPDVPARLGVRRFLFERFPFAAVFTEHDDAVVVLAFAHFYRKPGYWMDRL